jgi:hypothetical protein
MKAFYGQDLHWKKQYRGLFNLVEAAATDRLSMLNAFRAGRYHGLIEQTQLPSSGELPETVLADYETVSSRYMRKQHLFKRVKKMSGAVGRSLPGPVKAHLRKIFS